MEEIYLETREDLINFLKKSKYDFTLLKFTADWCNPCKRIAPVIDELVQNKIKHFTETNQTNKFIYVVVDVDECFDLYAYLKKQKMINGIPSIFLYSKALYSRMSESEIYIPSGSVVGTNENEIRNLFNFIK